MADGTSVGSLYYDLSIDDKNLKGQLNDADKKVGNFADNLKGGLTKAAAGFAVVGAGLTVIAKNATDFTVDLVKSSKSLGRQIGESTVEASRLVAAFGRMGVNAESASQMFGIFSKNIVKATQDSKEQASASANAQLQIEKTQRAIRDTTSEIQKNGDKTGDLTFKLKELNQNLVTQKSQLDQTSNAFEKLGIKTTDAQGNQKSFNNILFEVADKFKGMPDGIDKTAASMELFGRQGKEMIKILDLGSQGIKELEKKADEMGITLTDKNIKAVNDYVQSQKDLKESQDKMKLAIGTTTAPVLTEFNKAIDGIITSLVGTDGPMKTATVDVLAFGGPIAGFIGSFFGFAAAIVQVGEAIGFALLGGIGLVILAIALLGLAIYEMITHAEALGTFFVIVTDKIQMALKGVWDWVQQNWSLLLGFLLNPFAAAAGLIASHLEGIKNAVKGAAADAWHWLYDAGTAIIDGLVKGIKDKVNSAVDTVKGMGKSLISGLRGVLDWHSPSKVFMDAGMSISEGMALGIKRSAGLAMSAMDGLGNAVVSPTLALSPSGTGAGNSGSVVNHGDTVLNIGQINNSQDEAYVLRRLDRNQALEGQGISPTL